MGGWRSCRHLTRLALHFTLKDHSWQGCCCATNAHQPLALCSLAHSSSVAAQRDQFDLLLAQLDLKLIAGLEVEYGCVGLAHQQIAVELNQLR